MNLRSRPWARGAGTVDGKLELARVSSFMGPEWSRQLWHWLGRSPLRHRRSGADATWRVNEVVFEDADRGEFHAQGVGEVFVDGLFAGTDEAAVCEEAVGDGVLRRNGLARSAGASGELAAMAASCTGFDASSPFVSLARDAFRKYGL